MDLQHVNVKLLVESCSVDLEPLIPIFHNWIQNQIFDELLIDVADYRHVPAGPGVMLIGHQADYSVDNTANRLGVRYNRKAKVEGSNQERFTQATRSALKACERLEADDRLKGALRFNGGEIEIFINDRLLAPNTDATRTAAEPELREFCSRLFGGADFSLHYATDPRQLFRAFVNSSKAFSAGALLANLST